MHSDTISRTVGRRQKTALLGAVLGVVTTFQTTVRGYCIFSYRCSLLQTLALDILHLYDMRRTRLRSLKTMLGKAHQLQISLNEHHVRRVRFVLGKLRVANGITYP
jgi:hypothetical protein